MPVTESEIDAAGDHLGLGDGVVGRADIRRALEAAERAREGKKRGKCRALEAAVRAREGKKRGKCRALEAAVRARNLPPDVA